MSELSWLCLLVNHALIWASRDIVSPCPAACDGIGLTQNLKWFLIILLFNMVRC